MTYLPSQSGGGGSIDDNSIIAAPGEIQSSIDTATSSGTYGDSGYRIVRLESGKDYPISNTIEVKANVLVDCNGARLYADADVDLVHLYRNSGVWRPFIDASTISYSSSAIVYGPSTAAKLGTTNPARCERAYLYGNNGSGSGTAIEFRGAGQPVSMQRASGIINNFEDAVHFNAGSDRSNNWVNGNQFYGEIDGSVRIMHLTSDGAECSSNWGVGQVQAGNNTEWIVYIADDPRDPGSTDFTDGEYIRNDGSYRFKVWDWSNASNSFYDSSTDRRAPSIYLGRGKTYGHVMYDLGNKWGNEYVVNNSDVRASENAILAAHGEDVRGAVDFDTNSTFEPHSSGKDYHPDGNN
jgi:hypothetical protein